MASMLSSIPDAAQIHAAVPKQPLKKIAAGIMQVLENDHKLREGGDC
jgi:hypothetical protein